MSIYYMSPINRLAGMGTTGHVRPYLKIKKKKNKAVKVVTQTLNQLQKSLRKANANYKKAIKLNCNHHASLTLKYITTLKSKIYNMEVNNV